MSATRKEDCGYLLIALIPPGEVDAVQAMAEAAPDGTLFANQYVDPAWTHERADILALFEASGHAMVRGLAGRGKAKR